MPSCLVYVAVQVISLGHKDNVTVMQVRQNTEMESHEEKLHKMIIQSKINDTKVSGLSRAAASTPILLKISDLHHACSVRTSRLHRI